MTLLDQCICDARGKIGLSGARFPIEQQPHPVAFHFVEILHIFPRRVNAFRIQPVVVLKRPFAHFAFGKAVAAQTVHKFPAFFFPFPHFFFFLCSFAAIAHNGTDAPMITNLTRRMAFSAIQQTVSADVILRLRRIRCFGFLFYASHHVPDCVLHCECFSFLHALVLSVL